MTLSLFGSTQSVTFECEFENIEYIEPNLDGNSYVCEVQNSINITSLDDAVVDGISGEHLSGYDNDDVVAFIAFEEGQMHYFPRGLDKFFKNLKEIYILNTGLKEIHQSDLKPFPKLENLYLSENQLEKIEENLFEFNPNLKVIDLTSNRISYIHPNVFDKLTKLTELYIYGNNCYDPTELQNIISTTKVQCSNPNLEEKVNNVEIQSKNSNSNNLKKFFKISEFRSRIKINKNKNTKLVTKV